MDSVAYRKSDGDARRKPIGFSDIYDLIAMEAESGNDLSARTDFELTLNVSKYLTHNACK